jgi:hypothetical protein
METAPASRQLRELPPRSIGLLTRATILTGGFFQQFGWIFFVMGSLFSWIFIPVSTVRHWFEFGKDWKEIQGKVVVSEPTNSSVNDRMVYSYLYSFELDGQRYTGKSYGYGGNYSNGEEVTIRYNARNPSEGYIKGSKRAIFPAAVLFVLIFPMVGLAFIVSSVHSNWKAMRLLEIGEYIRAKLVNRESTNGSVTINNQTYPIYKYSFEFAAGGKTHQAVCKTHQAWLVENEEREIILYDRFNPEVNIVFDAYPNLPEISEEGMLKRPSIKKLLNLILPLIGIALNVLFFLANPFDNM